MPPPLTGTNDTLRDGGLAATARRTTPDSMSNQRRKQGRTSVECCAKDVAFEIARAGCTDTTAFAHWGGRVCRPLHPSWGPSWGSGSAWTHLELLCFRVGSALGPTTGMQDGEHGSFGACVGAQVKGSGSHMAPILGSKDWGRSRVASPSSNPSEGPWGPLGPILGFPVSGAIHVRRRNAPALTAAVPMAPISRNAVHKG